MGLKDYLRNSLDIHYKTDDGLKYQIVGNEVKITGYTKQVQITEIPSYIDDMPVGIISGLQSIRFDKGYPPVYPRADGMNYDADGFYNFYIGISKLPGDGQECRADKCISFVVVNSDSSDNEDMYEIELSESDQEIVLDILDKQCRRHLDKSCADLLAEAERGMQDVPSDHFSVPPDIPENHNGGLIT